MPHFYRSIPGWFDFEDVYADAAARLSHGGVAVEVGSWCGRSTCFLGETLRELGNPARVHAVDSWINWEHMGGVNRCGESVRPLFDAHMGRAGLLGSLVFPVQADSRDAARAFPDGEADFIFIDGDHSYEGVLADLFSWLPKLRRGGIIAGHDHDRRDVEWACNDFFAESVRHLERRGRCWWVDTGHFTEADWRRKAAGRGGSSRVFDCFLFYDELDLLEIRLRELEEVVDVFVLSEATHTFKGHRKPMHFLENLARFERWLPAIRHVTVVPPVRTPFTMDGMDEWDPRAWVNESRQRNAVANALDDCHRRDIILVSDVDEIPSASSVRNLPHDGQHRKLRHRGYHYNFNWWDSAYTSYTMDTGAVIFHNWNEACHIRTSAPDLPQIPSGWHCTWFGGDDKVAQKIGWYNHPLYGRQEYRAAQPRIMQTNVQLTWTDDLSVLPRAVQEDPARWGSLFDERSAVRCR